MNRIDRSGVGQIIMATHSPILMACPNANLLQLSKYGLEQIALEDTNHFRLMREFFADPDGFLQMMMED